MPLFKARKNNKSLADSLKTKTAGEIYSEKEFRSIIERERARADRTDQQFSLVVLDLGFTRGNHNTNRHLMQKLFSRMRRIDEIGWFDPQRIGIILPYTSEKGAQKFAESLCELMDPSMAQCVFNIYTYGSDRTSTKELNQELIRKGA
jgi:PleD family two-component response regulator